MLPPGCVNFLYFLGIHTAFWNISSVFVTVVFPNLLQYSVHFFCSISIILPPKLVILNNSSSFFHSFLLFAAFSDCSYIQGRGYSCYNERKVYFKKRGTANTFSCNMHFPVCICILPLYTYRELNCISMHAGTYGYMPACIWVSPQNEHRGESPTRATRHNQTKTDSQISRNKSVYLRLT